MLFFFPTGTNRGRGESGTVRQNVRVFMNLNFDLTYNVYYTIQNSQ